MAYLGKDAAWIEEEKRLRKQFKNKGMLSRYQIQQIGIVLNYGSIDKLMDGATAYKMQRKNGQTVIKYRTEEVARRIAELRG